jgi:translation initiation factor IF-2
LAKGIRVNQLAKELNVESKAILSKLRDEGLAERAPNHMSVLPLGLAESVREWIASAAEGGGGGGTAVETAAPVKIAEKRTVRRSKKAAPPAAEDATADGVGADGGPGITVEIAPKDAVDTAVEAAPVKKEARKSKAVPAAPDVAAAPAPPEPAVAPTTGPSAVEAPSAPAVEGANIAATIAAPAKGARAPKPAAAAPSAPPAGGATAPPRGGAAPTPRDPLLQPTPTRPTITLSNRLGTAPPAQRAPAPPVPKLTTLEPAKIQGPRVVREEKPETLPAPRARRPAEEAPAITPARPAAGRGVRVDDEDDDKKRAAAKKSGSLSNRRRGTDGRRGEAMEKLREFTEADLIERRDRLNAAAASRLAFDSHLRKSEARGTHQQAKTIVQRGAPVEIEEPITVKNLSSALGIKVNDIISKLMKQGVFATVNQPLDSDTATTIAGEYGIGLTIVQRSTMEQELEHELTERRAEATDLVSRPPVVTILGHVDHGKTSLLDKIRSANVAAGEAGGITQHTAAWMVSVGKKKVTFIDTPGHQAFTSMRARGANMTDVVVLVVSAAEGVQPQTIESINHARAANVPIVVALNKIDRPDANEQKVLGELAANELNPHEYGGDIEVVRTSATTGQGIKELLEILDLQAELMELKSSPSASARGTVVESRMDEGLGPVATVLVQDGTLRVGDIVLAGGGYGRVRSLLDDQGRSIELATASMPVVVAGLGEVPSAGDRLYAVDDMEQASTIAEERMARIRAAALAGKTAITADNLIATMVAADVQTINLIIKGDVQGSVETLVKTVTNSNTDEVKVRVIHSGAGPINESDVQLAIATMAKPTDNRVSVIGFHVVADDAARALAEQNHVEIKLYRVIYEIFDDLKKALSGMLEPEVREKLHGHAEIRQVFKVSRVGNIAGCMVTDGHIQKGSKMRVIRDGTIVAADLSIETLRRVKDDVKEVRNGFECGIKLAGYDDIKIGDRFEAYVRETIQRTL